MDDRGTGRERARHADGKSEPAPWRRGLVLVWLVVLPPAASIAQPVDVGAAEGLRAADPPEPPGPGERPPSSAGPDRFPAAFYGLPVEPPARICARRPLPEPLGEERPGHRRRVDRPPRLSA